MEELIQQAFVHVDGIGPHVRDGQFDLLGPKGEIILPQVWDTVVEPEWTVTMHMWPMQEPEEAKTPPQPLDEYHGNFNNLRNQTEELEDKDAKEYTLPPILPAIDAPNTTAYDYRRRSQDMTPIDNINAPFDLGSLFRSELRPSTYPQHNELESTALSTTVPSQ
jgi:hypothetical protein